MKKFPRYSLTDSWVHAYAEGGSLHAVRNTGVTIRGRQRRFAGWRHFSELEMLPLATSSTWPRNHRALARLAEHHLGVILAQHAARSKFTSMPSGNRKVG